VPDIRRDMGLCTYLEKDDTCSVQDDTSILAPYDTTHGPSHTHFKKVDSFATCYHLLCARACVWERRASMFASWNVCLVFTRALRVPRERLSYVLPSDDFSRRIFQKKISPGFHISFK